MPTTDQEDASPLDAPSDPTLVKNIILRLFTLLSHETMKPMILAFQADLWVI